MTAKLSRIEDALLKGSLPVLVALALAAGGLGPGSAAAQDRPAGRANYDLAQKFAQENVKKMVFDLNVIPEWIGGTDAFWYRWTTSKGTDFYLVDCGRRKAQKAFDPAVLAAGLSKALGKPVDPASLGIEQLIFPKGTRTVQFAAAEAIWELDRTSGRVRQLPMTELADERSPFNAAQLKIIRDYTGGGTLRGTTLFSPNDRWGVFSRDHNLFVVDALDPAKKEYQLTKDGEAWYGYDSSNDDGSSTKGQNQFVFVTWFPDSKRFFIKRTDNRKVRDMFLLQPLVKPVPTLYRYKNTLAGDEFSPQYELWVFNCETKTGLKIAADRWADQQIGGKAVDGGVYPLLAADKLLFIRTDRTWTRTDLAEADLRTGQVRTVIDEELHPNVTPTSAQVRILGQGQEIIWWSDRDGWGQFYLYDGTGRLKSRITTGGFCARSIVRVDEARRVLYFTASGLESGIDPYYEFLYRIGLDGRGLKRLTPEPATHPLEMLSVSPSGRFFVDNPSRVDLAPQAVVRDMNGLEILALAPPDLSNLTAAGWRAPETFKLKAADDTTDLYGVMWKPFDLKAGVKYPVIMVTYPGPISEAVPKSFSPLQPFAADLAQLGAIVVMFGNRGGSAERSKAYNAFGYGNLRDFGLPDKKVGLERLAAMFPFVDLDRVGVFGGSGGGFQSTSLMLTYPDLFKVCVSWAGNHDNSLMESYWPELNQGVREVPENGRTRFEVHTPTNMELARNLKGHYLIMQGLEDSRVHPAIAYRMIQALIEANKGFDMFIVPDEQHQVSRAKYLPYINRVIWQYFGCYLLGDPRSRAEVFASLKAPIYNEPWRYR